MSIRMIALAVPLVLGTACSTSSTQASKDHTGAMWTEQSSSNGGASSQQEALVVQPTSMQGTGSQAVSTGGSQPDSAQGGQGQGQGGSGSPSGSDSGAMGSGGSSETMGSSQQGQGASPDSGQGSSGTGASGSSDTTGSSAAAGGRELGGHSDDQTVTGKVAKLGKRSISIEASGGEAKTLKIVPQTVVTMNGKTAKTSQIKPGQQVRASFNQQGGQDVAVTIDVSGAGAGAGQHKMKGGHHGDTSGSSGSGSSGAGSGSSGSGGSDSPGSAPRRY